MTSPVGAEMAAERQPESDELAGVDTDIHMTGRQEDCVVDDGLSGASNGANSCLGKSLRARGGEGERVQLTTEEGTEEDRSPWCRDER